MCFGNSELIAQIGQRKGVDRVRNVTGPSDVLGFAFGLFVL